MSKKACPFLNRESIINKNLQDFLNTQRNQTWLYTQEFWPWFDLMNMNTYIVYVHGPGVYPCSNLGYSSKPLKSARQNSYCLAPDFWKRQIIVLIPLGPLERFRTPAHAAPSGVPYFLTSSALAYLLLFTHLKNLHAPRGSSFTTAVSHLTQLLNCRDLWMRVLSSLGSYFPFDWRSLQNHEASIVTIN